MVEPDKGCAYVPCCGSGAIFAQSEKFIEDHGGRLGNIAIDGLESPYLGAGEGESRHPRD